MSFNGVRLFRNALLVESALNIVSAAQMFYNPSQFLSMVLPDSAPHTAALKTQTQLMAAVILGLTAPLILSYPNIPRAAAARRITYTTLMAIELCIAATTAAQYALGDSGFKDGALFGMTAMMAGFASMRAYFLFVKPGWIEAQENAKKVK